jgi:TolA-binding protein
VSAAATPDPPAPTPPETPPPGITREEFDELQKRLAQFTETAERLANADTRAEEQRLERETREAASRVEQTAQRIGLSPADVGEIRGWIRAETKEAVREALDEIAEVRRSDGEEGNEPPASGDPPASSLADLSDGRTPPATPPPGDPPAAAAPPAPPAETPPKQDHWFHRPFGGQPAGDGEETPPK